MDNGYVDGLRQLDSRPRSPVIVPHNLSELRKKILFENTLLEERALHEFSAGKGDGAGVDTGSAPLKPLTSPTPSPTPTPTPAPAGIPVASTVSVNIAGEPYIYYSPFTKQSSGYEFPATGGYSLIVTSGTIYVDVQENADITLIAPNTSLSVIDEGNTYPYVTTSTWVILNFSDNDGEPTYSVGSTNPSTNATAIPTTGWSPSLTITAA